MLKRRAEYFSGRFCANQALQKLGISVEYIGRGKRGEPLWPDGILGSISHCKNLAIAVVGRTQGMLGVGIDIEDEISRTVLSNVLIQTLDKAEIALIHDDMRLTNKLFTLIFSIKESFFKAAYLHVRQYFGFESISIFDINFSTNSIDFILSETLSSKLSKGKIIRGYFKELSNQKYVTFLELF